MECSLNGPMKVTDEQIERALNATGGLLTYAAKKLGITYQALHIRLKKTPKLQNVYDAIQESHIDLAESGVVKHLKDQDPEMIRFYLQTKGKKRGYTKTVDHSFGNAESLQMHLNIKSKKIPQSQPLPDQEKESDIEKNTDSFGAADGSDNAT